MRGDDERDLWQSVAVCGSLALDVRLIRVEGRPFAFNIVLDSLALDTVA